MTLDTRPDRTAVVEEEAAPPVATAVENAEVAAYDPYGGRRHAALRLVQAIYLLFGILESLLAIRFVLKVLAANAQADFAAFIYAITTPFLVPFVGLFGTPQAGGSVLEVTTIVAVAVYALLAWLVARIVWLVVGETRSGVVAEQRTTRTRIRG